MIKLILVISTPSTHIKLPHLPRQSLPVANQHVGLCNMSSMDYSTQMRVIIRVCVADLPGEPLTRPWTLGNIFCNQILHRSLNPQPHPSGCDGMYFLEGFDSDKPVQRWFIYDLNVKCALSREDLLATIPHKVFLASRATGTWQDEYKVVFIFKI